MPKLTNTHVLLAKYHDMLISGLASDQELTDLLQIDNFKKSPGVLDISASISDSNHNKIDAMVDFVEEAARLISLDSLHRLTARLLNLSANKTASLFIQKASLEKIFLYHELSISPDLASDHFNSALFISMYPSPEERAAFASSMMARAQEYFKLVSAQTSSPASSSSSVVKRPIALLDVDHTLSFDNELNADLLYSLYKYGITDVYLFTDMVFRSYCIKDREALIPVLQQMGFTVHGTISTNDLFWRDLNDELVEYITRKISKKKAAFNSREFTDYFAKLMIKRPIIKTMLASGYLTGTAGEAYPQACAAEQASANSAYPKSFVAKFLAEMLQSQRGLVDPKGLMFELFLNHIPEWAGSLVIADDKPTVFQSIEQYIESASLMSGRRPTSLPITYIHVTELSMGQEYYNHLLQKDYRPISHAMGFFDLPHAGPSSSGFPSSQSSSMSSLSSSPVYSHVPRVSTDNVLFHNALLEALQPHASRSRVSSFFSSSISRAKNLMERLNNASFDELIPILHQYFADTKKIDKDSPEIRLLHVIQSFGLLMPPSQTRDLDVRENRQIVRAAFLDYSSQRLSEMHGLK